jgi:hypothetical protein
LKAELEGQIAEEAAINKAIVKNFAEIEVKG